MASEGDYAPGFNQIGIKNGESVQHPPLPEIINSNSMTGIHGTFDQYGQSQRPVTQSTNIDQY